ncbi:hypothetical protein BGW80DRAFT_1466038 [Lactifluus volemus]|nr:hypothetical protein BGW80DRAFT_1466038 [Lactifluus volemus]
MSATTQTNTFSSVTSQFSSSAELSLLFPPRMFLLKNAVGDGVSRVTTTTFVALSVFSLPLSPHTSDPSTASFGRSSLGRAPDFFPPPSPPSPLPSSRDQPPSASPHWSARGRAPDLSTRCAGSAQDVARWALSLVGVGCRNRSRSADSGLTLWPDSRAKDPQTLAHVVARWPVR